VTEASVIEHCTELMGCVCHVTPNSVLFFVSMGSLWTAPMPN